MTYRVDFIPTKRRARHTRRGNTYTDQKTLAELEAVRASYTGPKHEGPVMLFVDTFAELPKSAPMRIEYQPNTYKPDIDNTVKLVMDALNGKAWDDDRQVVAIKACKHGRTRNGGDYTEFEVVPSW